MDQPLNLEWQSRVLTDEELSTLLASKSALESMEILSKQVELRQRSHLNGSPQNTNDPAVSNSQPTVISEPAGLQSPVFDPVISESSSAIPVIDEVFTPPVSASPMPATDESIPDLASPVPESSAPASSIAQPQPLDDIAANLNALFANRAPAPQPVAIEPIEPEPAADLLPEPAPIATPAQGVPSLLEESQKQETQTRDEFEEPFVFEAISTPIQILPSAEEAITEFEETHQEEALPELVDEIIKSVGGVDDSIPNVPAEPAPKPVEHGSGTRKARSLLTTWNGTGVLLLMASVGYVGALGHMALGTLLAGSFVAMALTGFGFAAAALAARRGHLPQSVLSRAAFGVNGALIPLALVVIARFAATAMLALFAVVGLNWFFTSVPASVAVPVGSQNMQIGTGYLVALGVLVLGWLATLFGPKTSSWITRVMAGVLVGGSLVFVALAYVQHPMAFKVDSNIDFASALGIASLVMAIIGILWGTSAADENPDLISTTMVPKLLAAGLLNFSILGLLAAAAGYGFYQLRTDNIASTPLGIAFVVVAVFSFANLIRRNGDMLAGFGLKRVGIGFRTLALLVVAVASLLFVWKLSLDSAWSMFTAYLTFGSVPVLSWLTIFGVDSVLRTTQYHEVSLARSYGFYGRFNLANLIGWALATGIGWGFLNVSQPEFSWLGYFSNLVGTAPMALSANLGVWIAMGISVLVPIAFTIPRIRNQEAEVLALEARRTELLDVLGISE